MPLLCCGLSDQGLVRKTNQDSILINPLHKCFVVADGMGGHRGGDIASQLTIQIFADQLAQLKADDENKVPVLNRSIQLANKLIFEKSQQDAGLEGMGTTVTSLLIHNSKAYLANVGDSRIYLINNQKIYQLTRDHSLVQEKLNLGIYGREEAMMDKNKNILVRTLGFEDSITIDIFEYAISKNDLFLLCSDGLYSKVYDDEILDIINQAIPDPSLCSAEDIQLITKKLIQRANELGGNDNISVILALAQSKNS
ncbi:MAG: Stp1/IreP family PP2C-type Ser/Thr phosphatase [Bacteriovoracaceae bacterium]|nr:Stp1/IreP family PP2C-type Ser/Thr phosphatase [Bacteriovoracaceae bacterium]